MHIGWCNCWKTAWVYRNGTGDLARSPIGERPADLEVLKRSEVRLYTERDTTRWRVTRSQRYEEMNAGRIKRLHSQLQAIGHTRIRLIETKDRNVRHGQRHPHAGSIVEEKDLISWVLGEVN